MQIYTLPERITANPNILGGKPTVRGRTLTVEQILTMLENGCTMDRIIEGNPGLEREDIRACLCYARRLVAEERMESMILDLAA